LIAPPPPKTRKWIRDDTLSVGVLGVGPPKVLKDLQKRGN